MNKVTLIVLVVLSLVALETGAAPSPVLIPSLYIGPGAFGSRWSTAVVLNNHMDVPFTSPGVTFLILCGIPEGCFSEEVGTGQFGGISNPSPANGLLLYLPAENASIAFMARVAASPRNPLEGGTELPVVRESAFSRAPLRFPNVPLHPPNRLRTTLRIYAPDAQAGTSVRVELRSSYSPTGVVTGAKVVSLPAPSQTTALPIFPGYAQLNLQDEFLESVQIGASFNVTVIPLPLDSSAVPRIWGFVTITDNVTQEVTVQRPQ